MSDTSYIDDPTSDSISHTPIFKEEETLLEAIQRREFNENYPTYKKVQKLAYRIRLRRGTVSSTLRYPCRTWIYRFLKRHTSVRSIVPTPIDEARFNASTLNNVVPFLQKLLKLVETHRYHPDLILQMDETSLQSKAFRPSKYDGVVRMRRLRPLFQNSFTLSPDMDIPRLIDFKYRKYTVTHTPRGWMTQEAFAWILKTQVYPEIERVRQDHIAEHYEHEKRMAQEKASPKKRSPRKRVEGSSEIEMDYVPYAWLPPQKKGENGKENRDRRGTCPDDRGEGRQNGETTSQKKEEEEQVESTNLRKTLTGSVGGQMGLMRNEQTLTGSVGGQMGLMRNEQTLTGSVGGQMGLMRNEQTLTGSVGGQMGLMRNEQTLTGSVGGQMGLMRNEQTLTGSVGGQMGLMRNEQTLTGSVGGQMGLMRNEQTLTGSVGGQMGLMRNEQTLTGSVGGQMGLMRNEQTLTGSVGGQMGLMRNEQPLIQHHPFLPDSHLQNLSSSERALIILDGHNSHSQPELMAWLAARNVDVIVLPSHTSEFLQPLDQVVNKEWKRALKAVSLPKNKRDQTQLNTFMNQIDIAVTKALQADYIRKGLRNTGQSFEEWKQSRSNHNTDDDEFPDNSDDSPDPNWVNRIKASHLDDWDAFQVEDIDSIKPLKPSASFPISGHVLADQSFLRCWCDHLAARERLKDEKESARRIRTEKRRAMTFRKLEKLTERRGGQSSVSVTRERKILPDDSSESSDSFSHSHDEDAVKAHSRSMTLHRLKSVPGIADAHLFLRGSVLVVVASSMNGVGIHTQSKMIVCRVERGQQFTMFFAVSKNVESRHSGVDAVIASIPLSSSCPFLPDERVLSVSVASRIHSLNPTTLKRL
ncbi:hypothetical protein BLNAU_15355 [Blattamonas nauphoetae]|uniref:DDE-1 domain-containing protein n=1 Tax=Blattamonas nauphoetae TaxID=2049346 RepID=A0ABQ9XDB5_9EUKA|nr:hypothetical protein BLNAU_15355 [Blattamonas nauphoetae]